MASPQLEHGHSRLANEILEAIIRCPPATVTARQLWDWVWRHSWGWKGAATTRPTSVRGLAEALGLSHGAAGRALEALLGTQHAVRHADGSLSIQKDHERWVRDTRLARKPPASKQLFLLESPVDKCPTRGDKASHGRGQKCPTGGDGSVPTRGTRTIRNLKKERKERGGASAAAPNFSTVNGDTPRTRAEAGDPERPPEEHPAFGKLGFKRRDELTEQWKESRAKRLCRKGCGRVKASDAWPFCRACTACARCGAKADGQRNFTTVRGEVVCKSCKESAT